MARSVTKPKAKPKRRESTADATPVVWMTQSEYARHRDVTPQTIAAWRRAGRLVTQGEGRALLVNRDASDRLVNGTRDPQQDAAQGADGGADAADLNRHKAEKEKHLAELARLKVLEQKRRLVDRATTQDAVFVFLRGFRTDLLNMPAQSADAMAARLGCDAHALRGELDAVLRKYLEVQSKKALRLGSRPVESDGDAEALDDDDA